MKYTTIKWLILLIPPIAIGLWEYVRHAYLIPFLSMDAGNVLAPFIVLGVTLFPLLKLMSHMKRIEQELHEEKVLKSILSEREHIARELHDGLAQSLFLLSVKVNKLRKIVPEEKKNTFNEIMNAMETMNEDVRKSIANLREPSSSNLDPVSSSFPELTRIAHEQQIDLQIHWKMDEENMNEAERTTLYACIKESVMNAIKHSSCTTISINGEQDNQNWQVRISDNGTGFNQSRNPARESQGLAIMRQRVHQMRWQLEIDTSKEGTTITLLKQD